jgi:hypothetical protein
MPAEINKGFIFSYIMPVRGNKTLCRSLYAEIDPVTARLGNFFDLGSGFPAGRIEKGLNIFCNWLHKGKNRIIFMTIIAYSANNAVSR